MPDVALESEGIKGVWLVSNTGCAPGVISLISVANASGGCGQKKLKRLMQAKQDINGVSERDYMLRVMFRQPDGCEVWSVPRSGPIKRVEPAARVGCKAEVGDAVESVLVG